MKSNSEKIIEQLEELKKKTWLSNRKWWPDYLYHFTDILNAVNILKCGSLYSRNKAVDQAFMITDNASPDVISHTQEAYKDYVRLYFRPKTPTQYNNEGFRPTLFPGYLKAHCPIPIMFLFSPIPILSADETLFTDGNIASPGVNISDEVSFFLSLSFEDIYHNSSLYGFDQQRKSSIIYHRQSEILIKNELPLSNLSQIFCRSQAEYETLRSLLPKKIWQKYSGKIGVDSKNSFFFAEWPFIQMVELQQKLITVLFNSPAVGPYNIKMEIRRNSDNQLFEWRSEAYYIQSQFKLDLSKINNLGEYKFKIEIDNHIAYLGKYAYDHIVF
jgi:hypothetical protein